MPACCPAERVCLTEVTVDHQAMLKIDVGHSPSTIDLWGGDTDLEWAAGCFERAAEDRLHPPGHLQNASAQAWLWCFRCERAFQRGDEPGPSCIYSDCDGGPHGLWQWRAYRAFTANDANPATGAQYSLSRHN
jgi:hypothetical protein